MNVLDDIVRAKGSEIDALRSRAHELRARARDTKSAPDFAAALRLRDRLALVAEVKRRSPSAGWIDRDLDAAHTAAAYESAGAAAVSVLTDARFFGGSLDDLRAVTSRVDVPVLRKDFVLDAVQVWEARAAGAAAVLLIVRILDDAALARLLDVAAEAGVAALVEVHEEREAERALRAGATVIGVNNRDLDNLVTDLAVTERVAPRIPAGAVLVAESGIGGPADAARLAAAGVDALLVGESLVRSGAPGKAAAALARIARGAARTETAWK